jgi:hypothetical protein
MGGREKERRLGTPQAPAGGKSPCTPKVGAPVLLVFADQAAQEAIAFSQSIEDALVNLEDFI